MGKLRKAKIGAGQKKNVMEKDLFTCPLSAIEVVEPLKPRMDNAACQLSWHPR
jgi:hypothetical protein